MNDQKHVIVGLFVLVGAVLLGAMVVWFEGVSIIIRGGYVVTAHLPSGVGIRAGKRVFMDGLEIGEVREVTSSRPEKAGVYVRMRVDPHVSIPRSARLIVQQTTLGEMYLDFQTAEPKAKPGEPPAQQRPAEDFLPTDGTAVVPDDQVTIKPPGILPEDIQEDLRQLAAQFKGLDGLVANLRDMTEPRTLEDVKQGKPRNLRTALEQFEVTAKSLNDEITQPGSDLKTLLAEARASAKDLRAALAKASETLEKTGQTVDEAKKTIKTLDEAGQEFKTAGKNVNAVLADTREMLKVLNEDAKKANDALTKIDALAADLRGGKGTMGKLLTDDELHRALVTLIENLQVMTEDARRLVVLWRRDGILFGREK